MRVTLLCLLITAAAHAKYAKPRAAESELVVIHDWTLEALVLQAGKTSYPVDVFYLADRVNSVSICTARYRDVMRKYMRGLDRKRPLIVELVAKQKGGKRFVAGIWPLDKARLEADLKLEAKVVEGRVSVRLVNRGKVAHTVVLPKDGSESGWREPAVHFERKIEKRWVRGNGIGRCGVFAHDWARDIVTLEPGEGRDIGDGYAPLPLTHGKGEMTVRAHYVYRTPGRPKGIGPGAMGSTPGFELVSNAVKLTDR